MTEDRSGGLAGVFMLGVATGLAAGWAYQWLFDFVSHRAVPIWILPVLGAGGSTLMGTLIGVSTGRGFARKGGRDQVHALAIVLAAASMCLLATYAFKYQRQALEWMEIGEPLPGFFGFLGVLYDVGFTVVSASGRGMTSPFNGGWVVLFWMIEAALVLGSASRATIREVLLASEADEYAELSQIGSTSEPPGPRAVPERP